MMSRNCTMSSLFLVLATILLACVVMTLSDVDTTTSPLALPDISDPNLTNVVRFKLDRKALRSPHLGKRATLQRREEEVDQELKVVNTDAAMILPEVSSSESGFPVPLTDIPKDYGYTAVFSIGTYASSSSALSPTADNISIVNNHFFRLLVDTGSDLVVVTSATANDPECIQVAHRYNATASLTSAPTQNMLTGGNRWVQQYGDGTFANGTLIQDTLRFVSFISVDDCDPNLGSDWDSDSDSTSTLNLDVTSGNALSNTNMSTTEETTLQVTHQPILVVDQPGLHLSKSYGPGVDGIIGLNLKSPVITSTVIQNLQKTEIAARAGIPSFSSSLLSSSSLPSWSSLASTSNSGDYGLSSESASPSGGGMGFMSLWLSQSLEPGQGGELLLNAVDKTRFQGPIRWSDRGPDPYDWSVPLDKGLLLIDSVSQTTLSIPETDHTFAVLDSGSDGIYLQQSVYNALFQLVPGSKQLSNGYWRVPCEGTMELVVGTQGKLYRIPYEDWVKKPNETSSTMASGGPGMCQSRVYGSSPGPILLGTTFLRSVYTVFDFSTPGNERMGFAALA